MNVSTSWYCWRFISFMRLISILCIECVVCVIKPFWELKVLKETLHIPSMHSIWKFAVTPIPRIRTPWSTMQYTYSAPISDLMMRYPGQTWLDTCVYHAVNFPRLPYLPLGRCYQPSERCERLPILRLPLGYISRNLNKGGGTSWHKVRSKIAYINGLIYLEYRIWIHSSSPSAAAARGQEWLEWWAENNAKANEPRCHDRQTIPYDCIKDNIQHLLPLLDAYGKKQWNSWYSNFMDSAWKH